MGLRKRIKRTISKSVGSVVSKAVDVVSAPTKYVVDKTSVAGKYINYSLRSQASILNPIYGVRLIRDYFSEDRTRIIEEYKAPLSPEELHVRECGRFYPPFRDWAFSKTSAPPRFISARKPLSFSHFGARYGRANLYLIPFGYNKPRPMIQHSYNADTCTSILSNKEGVVCFTCCYVKSDGTAAFGSRLFGAHPNPDPSTTISSAYSYANVLCAEDAIKLYEQLANNPRFLGGMIDLNDPISTFPIQGTYEYVVAVIKDGYVSAYPEWIKIDSNNSHAVILRNMFAYFQQLKTYIKESVKESVIHYDECVLNK